MFAQVVGAPYVPSAAQCRDDGPVPQTSVPGTHTPAHWPLIASQMKGQAPVGASIQLPAALQVCGVPPLHCFSFTAQARHSPLLQGTAVQLVTTVQCPLASHVCTAVPEHRFDGPGTHSPPHWLVAESHTKVHAVAGDQCPVASHVSIKFAEPATQRALPGLQSPPHVPLSVHTVAQGVSGWLIPAASHRKGVLPLQLLVSGRHDPVQAVVGPLPLHTNGQRVGVSRQIPCRSHCWMTGLDGLQRLSPAIQAATHAPTAASQLGRFDGQGA